MVFRIPEEREFRLVVEGLYEEFTNRTLPFFLEIDCKRLDRYSLYNSYPYFDYWVSFRVVDLTEHFLEMHYENYDPIENGWLFSYCNILGSEAGSSDTIYDLFVQVSYSEEREEKGRYVPVIIVYVWVEFQDPNGNRLVFL